jgi:nucleoid-associated protein YgaU
MSDEESLSTSGTRSKSRSGGGQTYTVKSGDTLSKISKKMYGDSSKWNRIYNANKSTVPNPNKLKVGTKLVIP